MNKSVEYKNTSCGRSNFVVEETGDYITIQDQGKREIQINKEVLNDFVDLLKQFNK